jgi:hypothetical protein
MDHSLLLLSGNTEIIDGLDVSPFAFTGTPEGKLYSALTSLNTQYKLSAGGRRFHGRNQIGCDPRLKDVCEPAGAPGVLDNLWIASTEHRTTASFGGEQVAFLVDSIPFSAGIVRSTTAISGFRVLIESNADLASDAIAIMSNSTDRVLIISDKNPGSSSATMPRSFTGQSRCAKHEVTTFCKLNFTSSLPRGAKTLARELAHSDVGSEEDRANDAEHRM